MSKSRKYGKMDPKDFLRYSGDGLTDEERHALEREMQKDAFAEEAFEGLSSVSAGEAMKDMYELRSRLGKRVGARSSMLWVRIAASIVLILAVGTLYFTVIQDRLMRTDQIASETESAEPAREKSASGDQEIPDEDAIESGQDKEVTIESAIQERENDDRSFVDADETASPGAAAGSEREAGIDLEAVAGSEAAITSGPETEFEAEQDFMVDEEIIIADEMSEAEDTLIMAFEEAAIDEIKDAGTGTVSGESALNLSRAGQADIAQPTALEGESREKRMYEEIADKAAFTDQVIPDSIPAMPIGGMESFGRYIRENLRFPEEDTLSSGGLVIMRFNVGPDRRPRNIEISETPGYAFSMEAVRLLQEGPDWTPAFRNGIPVNEKTRISIEFSR